MKKIKLRILGKHRELVSDGNGLWFLNNVRDCCRTKIFCGLTLAEWRDQKYLKSIQAKIWG